MNDFLSFNPNRLKFARKRRGLTIKKLGSLSDLTSRTISNYENGKITPKDNVVNLLSTILKFPKEFFFLDDIYPIDEISVSFRAFSKMTASVRDSALCAAQIALEFSNWIDKKFKLPPVSLLDLNDFEPEAAAETIRNEWAYGVLPIQNMIHLLESKGVRVFSLSENTLNMDAFSFWIDGQPFIFLNTKKSVERSRFDAAHELGHLVLHKHGSPLGTEIEREANLFASAFLMPENSVTSKIPYLQSMTLNTIFKLKSNWKVSAAALVRRMKDLKLLSEWHYRIFMIELSKGGHLKEEPFPIKNRETSRLLPLIFETLRKEGKTKDYIAKELCIFPQDIDSLIFNLAIIGLNGGGKNQPNGFKNNNQSYLKRIK